MIHIRRQMPPSSSFDLFNEKYNHLYLYGDVSENGIEDLRNQIDKFQQDLSVPLDIQTIVRPNPILLHINSPGGDLSAGLACIRTIRTSKTPVDTVVDGIAYSAGAMIAAAGRKRFALSSSAILIHQHSEYFKNDYTHEDVVTANEASVLIYSQLRQFLLDNSKFTQSTIDQYLSRDKYLSPQEALKFGLIDRIIPPSNKALSLAYLSDYGKPSEREFKLNSIRIPYAQSNDRSVSADLMFVKSIHLVNSIYKTSIAYPGQTGINLLHGKPAPMKLLIHEQPFANNQRMLAIVGAILHSAVPVICYIDGLCTFHCAIVALVCHERYMNVYGSFTLDLRYLGDDSAKHKDRIVNTKFMRAYIIKLFSNRTKMSNKMIESLFEKAITLTAKQALECGLVDGVLDESKNRFLTQI